MKLLHLNQFVPQMQQAPHGIYLLEFEFKKGELALFNLFPAKMLKTFEEFKDIDETTTINKIGVEGTKGNKDHSALETTHALVADVRPIGIYVIFWDKPTTPEYLDAALKSELFSALTRPTT